MKKGITVTTILVIASIVFLLITIVAVSQLWPLVRYGPFSPCWGSAASRVNNLAGIDLLKRPQTFSVGDCMSGIYFVNKGYLDQTREHISEEEWDYIGCDEGASYVLAVPVKNSGDLGWNFWEWPEDVWKKLVEFWKNDIGGIKPICKVLDREKPLENNVYLNSTVTYCIKVEQNEDRSAYRVIKAEMSPDEKCDDTLLEKKTGMASVSGGSGWLI